MYLQHQERMSFRRLMRSWQHGWSRGTICAAFIVNRLWMAQSWKLWVPRREQTSPADVKMSMYGHILLYRTSPIRCSVGVGNVWKYQLDEKLFRRSTRDARKTQLTECQFADDAAILDTTRVYADVEKGIAQASRAYGALSWDIFKDRIVLPSRPSDWCMRPAHTDRNAGHLYTNTFRTGSISPQMSRIRAVLGTSSQHQWDQHLTSRASGQHWGDLEPLSRRVTSEG